MNARIAKKIVTCKSSLYKNLPKLIQARLRLARSNFIFMPIKGHDWNNYEIVRKRLNEKSH
jgi:hypothetical protein